MIGNLWSCELQCETETINETKPGSVSTRSSLDFWGIYHSWHRSRRRGGIICSRALTLKPFEQVCTKADIFTTLASARSGTICDAM